LRIDKSLNSENIEEIVAVKKPIKEMVITKPFSIKSFETQGNDSEVDGLITA